MPGLQSLLEKFVTTTHGYTTDSETVFSHPLTDARIALATDDETIRALTVYGWIVAEPSLEPSFNVLPALQRTFPELLSQHPDELDRLLAHDSVAKLIEAQQVEHRGRMARWLLGRSRSTGNTELAKWTREACADIAIQSSHPLAPRLDRPTYIQGPESLGRITGSELTGYQLLLVASSNGRTMLSSAPTMDELFAPNVEWTAAQWSAYEQLLRAIPCSEQTFATQVTALRADAACHSQHLWAIQQGTAAYLGTATEDLRRRFRHSPSSQWLDSASAETGISLRSAGGMNRLIDLYMVEHLTDSEVLDHIVPAMRDADSDFAELSDTALAAIWRSAYNPILNSVLRASADEAVRLRVGETPPAIKSSPDAMRGLLSSYYGEAPIATLELAGKLHLVSTVDDLPPSLQDEVYLIGGRDRVSGITFEGAVYLIGANTAPEDVCSVFLHEVGEHAALRSMLGRDYGRIVQRFNHLLSEGDTYAVQASMQVPNSTAPSNLDSEHLAHLIQLAAADIEAKEGGEGGFDLGQRCLRDLRTWLYRTPLMRELERQGELEDFKLDAHDIATLAREAVDFHVADIQHSTTALNQWDSKLDSDFVSVLHKQTVSERVDALQHLPLEQQIAYVYALGTMQATDGAETLVRMAGAVAEASNSADEVTRLLASEVSALTLRLSTQSRASRHLDTQGLFAAMSGTDTPSASVLTLIRSAPNGKWVAEHYQNGLGLTLLEDFDTKEAAVQILGQHHFPVQSKELDSVIARWGSAIAAEHRQLDSQAFKRWFAGSVTRYSDGTPMVLYHGTAKNFSKANGIFWASAPTPAEQRPAPAPAPIVELPKVETPFDQWFGTHVGHNMALKGSTLADEYAELRQDMARYSQPALEADRALVMPVYLNVKSPFDGDKLSSSSLMVGELRDELVRQTEAAGRHIDVMLVASLVKTITKAARVEESGPYYRRHDFWMNRTSHFGGAGAAALQQLFTHCGFDSIKLTENDHLTFGVFSAAQVKSASGNTGLYSANPDIRFAFAGTNAATSDLSRLKQAKLLAKQDVSADDIWKITGWMFGADGDWRFEIDDSKARIRGYDHEKDEAEVTTTEPDRFVDWVEESIHRRSGVPLSQFYDHPELYAAYPQLANLNVVAVERMPGDETLGSFGFNRSFAQSTLYVAAPYTLRSDGPTFEEVLAHETQHCIQHIEGFGPGAMVSYFESDQTTSDELKSSMLAYIEIHDHSKSLGCSPEKFAELSGYSQQIIERVGTWRQQGNWDSNVTSFRRSVMSPFELYFHEAGEVEARNTQHRIDMSAEQRAVTFPLDTIDVESSLIRVSRKFRVFADSTMAPDTTAYGRADSAFEWAIKTQGWRTGLNDNAQLLHAGNAMNLFAVKTDAASRAYHGEIFAVALDDSVIGSFLYGPAPEGAGQLLNAASMVHPDFRRQGIASAAYNAIEGLTGKKLAPSLANTSSSAQAFWEARQAPATKNATVGDSNALSQWMRQSSTVGADGKPTVFYHGTMAAFENFDAARHRSILNNGYQGDAFHFSPSPDVASSYATAARNQLFRQFDLYQAAEKALPPTITQLLKGLVEEGHAIWAKYSEDEFCNMRDLCLSKGFDINDLMDLSEYVEGSAGIHPRESINLFAEHHDCDMPDDIKDLAVNLGLADAVPVPIVMPVYLRCENTLYTDDKQQARDAQSNGYDSVCYSGDGTVGQDPEWMVFHTANIRSVFEFEQDAKVLMQEHSNPLSPVPGASITPPATTLFDYWFEGSSCINQFGEPRLVFVQDNPGNAFNTFADLNAASPDAQGKVTPAILAIRSPFIVTDSAHIAITDLNDKLGRRKAGLIVGDLLRDGQLGIEDIIKNPRCNKWIQQAGYDGAIYRNRDGENRYVTFDDAQAVVGSAVQRSLNESSQWGPIPAAPAMSFVGDRARARQFTLSNHGKPHGHVVPMGAADQYLANSDRLYINHLGNIRLSATNIAAMCEATDTPKHLSEFLTRNRKGLAGKARIEDIFAEHIRSLRQGINQARMDARADTPQASYQRNMVDKLSNALVWAIEHSSSGKSFKGLVSEDLLQWNKPLSQQSPMVLQVLSTLGINGLYQVVGSGTVQLKTCNRYTADEFTRDYPDGRVEQIDATGLTGRACFEELANDLGGSKQAADLLSSMGITGAQQSTAEVLLFKPSYTHAPLLPLALCKTTPGALNGDSLAIQDLGGVMIKGGVHTACKSLWGNQERALEVVESAINLLSTRHSQLADFSSPLAVNDQHNKQQLAEAKALQQELMFTAIPSQFLPWADPLSEQHLKTLSPVIKIDPAHALPGSAVFRLIAGRQEGIEGAKAMLSKVGIVGVCTEDVTLAWSTGARKVCNTVTADTPTSGYAPAESPATYSRPSLSMS